MAAAARRKPVAAKTAKAATPRRAPRTAKKSAAPSAADAERRLDGFIAKFSASDQKRIRAIRKALRKRLPSANELVWDNYNFFVIGYCPTERPYDSPLSMACDAHGVSLCFLYGAALPDPQKQLHGSGSQTRFVRLESAVTLAHPPIENLIAASVARAKHPFAASGRGKLIIRAVSAKQRPRRKPES